MGANRFTPPESCRSSQPERQSQIRGGPPLRRVTFGLRSGGRMRRRRRHRRVPGLTGEPLDDRPGCRRDWRNAGDLTMRDPERVPDRPRRMGPPARRRPNRYPTRRSRATNRSVGGWPSDVGLRACGRPRARIVRHYARQERRRSRRPPGWQCGRCTDTPCPSPLIEDRASRARSSLRAPDSWDRY